MVVPRMATRIKLAWNLNKMNGGNNCMFCNVSLALVLLKEKKRPNAVLGMGAFTPWAACIM